MIVKDLMKKEIVTVPADLPALEIVKLFQERCISGAPVVDEDGTVLGVVSQTDLLTEREEACAAQVMTPGAIAVDERTPISEVAKAMLERHIHRMLVTRDGKLAGILTTMDLLRVLAGEIKPASRRASAAKRPAAPSKKKR